MDLLKIVGDIFGIVKSIQNIISVICDTLKKCSKNLKDKKRNEPSVAADSSLFLCDNLIIIVFNNEFVFTVLK